MSLLAPISFDVCCWSDAESPEMGVAGSSGSAIVLLRIEWRFDDDADAVEEDENNFLPVGL